MNRLKAKCLTTTTQTEQMRFPPIPLLSSQKMYSSCSKAPAQRPLSAADTPIPPRHPGTMSMQSISNLVLPILAGNLVKCNRTSMWLCIQFVSLGSKSSYDMYASYVVTSRKIITYMHKKSPCQPCHTTSFLWDQEHGGTKVLWVSLSGIALRDGIS